VDDSGPHTVTSKPCGLCTAISLFKSATTFAPSQEVPVVIRTEGRNEAKVMKWGLVPSWAPDSSMGQRMNNARSETQSKSFN
jgi:putative SOS response-associated peptidase YedK